MTLQVQRFTQALPSAPALLGGMVLGSAGVSHPPLQTIGLLSGTSAADGAFSDINGYGHVDYDVQGRMYVADTDNNRVQRFVKDAAGVWQPDGKAINIGQALGSASAHNTNLLAIDRVNNQIHLGAYNYYNTGSAFGVWNLSSWPNLTTGNRVRSWGSNASSNVVGHALLAGNMMIDDTYAVISSLVNPFRVLRWNHQTNTLLNEETQGGTYSFATDRAGDWFSSAPSSGAGPGLRTFDPATMTEGTRFDTAQAGNFLRAGRFPANSPRNPVYHGGRIYIADTYGRVQAFDATSGAPLGEYLSPGGLDPGNLLRGRLFHTVSSANLQGRIHAIVDGDGMGWFAAWSANAANDASQCFLTMWPMSTAIATWSKTGWSSGVNTIKSVFVVGTKVADEKIRLQARKNGGAWVAFTCAEQDDEAKWAGVGTFTGADVLELQVQSSSWDRLDGEPGAVSDKLSPSNMRLKMEYEDTAATTYVPQPTTEFQLQADAGPSYQLYLD